MLDILFPIALVISAASATLALVLTPRRNRAALAGVFARIALLGAAAIFSLLAGTGR